MEFQDEDEVKCIDMAQSSNMAVSGTVSTSSCWSFRVCLCLIQPPWPYRRMAPFVYGTCGSLTACASGRSGANMCHRALRQMHADLHAIHRRPTPTRCRQSVSRRALTKFFRVPGMVLVNGIGKKCPVLCPTGFFSGSFVFFFMTCAVGLERGNFVSQLDR